MSDKQKPNEILKGEEGLLLDHNYDGIQELDHPLPRWWITIFYATIVFSVFYVGYYMVGSGPTLRQEMDAELKQLEALKPAPTEGGDELLLAAIGNSDKIKHGGEVFAGKCVACHGDKGQGLIGPNLADDFWIHGEGKPADIAKVVKQGVLEKGMPPWEAMLTPDELTDVVAFVYALNGTNPPGAKEAQGTEHKRN